MEDQKKAWIKKHAEKALHFWQDHEYGGLVSDEYRNQIETDLHDQYEDPVKREFTEMLWVE
jgi:hypothetical protein